MSASARKKATTRPKLIDLPIAADGTTPRVVILGRGTLTGTMIPDGIGGLQPARKLEALRLRRRTMDRVRALVAGPVYLAVDLLLQRACDALEQQDRIEAIRAEDLES